MPIQPTPLLFSLGRPVAPLYAALMNVRATCYQKGIFTSHTLPVPVISVGNLTMGGSGKTPLVIYIARLLSEIGYKPAVISRGYRGNSRGKINIVSDGSKILMTSDQCGDEPYLVARSLSDVVVATGKRRLYPSKEVISRYGCDCIILDDGFQHLSIVRDIDLVLFDVDHFAGNSRVFPGGELREPVSALGRATAFILTGTTSRNTDRAKQCEKLLLDRFPTIPIYRLSRRFAHVVKYTGAGNDFSEDIIQLDDVPKDLLCFCGIALPERFYKSLEEHGICCIGRKTFGDHHAFTEKDINSLVLEARKTGASGLITTGKDITKIRAQWAGNTPVYTPHLEIPEAYQLNQYILAQLERD